MSTFFGIYSGLVVSTEDSLQLGRVKVRVPLVHGFEGNPSGLVIDNDLPWALPMGLPAGGSHDSGGISWIPVVGDQVWVQFLDGELEKPLWQWGNQNAKQAKVFTPPLHKYKKAAAALRAALARFGHWIEFLPGGLDFWTAKNWHFTILDGSYFRWQSPSGAKVELTDKNYSVSIGGDEKYTVGGNETHTVKGTTTWTVPQFYINGDLWVSGDSDGSGNFTAKFNNVNWTVRNSVTWQAPLTRIHGNLEVTGTVTVHGTVYSNHFHDL